MGSKGESFHLGGEHTNTKDLAEKWQKDLNEFVYGTIVNPLGRLRQAALVTEGLVFGGISDIGNHSALEMATTAGEATLVGGVLGTLMASKYRLVKSVITLAGSLGGLVYAGSLWDHHSKDVNLTKALDTVYNSNELKTFNDQTSVANKSLGKDGFTLGLTGLAGGVGFGAAAKFAPHVAFKFGPTKLQELFYDFPRPQSAMVTVHTSPAFGKYKSAFDEEVLSGVKVGHEAPVAEASGMATAAESKLACGNEQVNIFASGQYKHRVSLDKFVRQIVDGEVGIEYGESAGYKFDGKNNLQSVVVPHGASSDEVVRRLLVGSSAKQIGEWEFPLQAARQGSHEVGFDAPHSGDLSKTFAEGKPFHESNIGQFRRSEGAQRYAVEGSESYYKGEAGNDYTTYLKQQHGEWTPERQSVAESMLTDSTQFDSPFNPNYFSAQDILSRLAFKPTAGNLAVASNLVNRFMPPSDQARAIRAVAAYLEQHPSVVKLTGAEKNSAIGKLASELSGNDVEIITDTFIGSNGAEFPVLDNDTSASVQSLLSKGTVKRAGTAYKLLLKYSGSNVNKPRIEAAEEFVASACELGMNDEQLLADGCAEAINNKITDLLYNGVPYMIRDLALCAKILGPETTLEDVFAVNTMRTEGWDLKRITVQTVETAKHLLRLGELPTMKNIFRFDPKNSAD